MNKTAQRIIGIALGVVAVSFLIAATTPGIGPETDWIKLFKRSADTPHNARTNIFSDLAPTPGQPYVATNANGSGHFADVVAISTNGVQAINGNASSNQFIKTLLPGSGATDISLTTSNGPSGSTNFLEVPTASATARGAVAGSDFVRFDSIVSRALTNGYVNAVNFLNTLGVGGRLFGTNGASITGESTNNGTFVVNGSTVTTGTATNSGQVDINNLLSVVGGWGGQADNRILLHASDLDNPTIRLRGYNGGGGGSPVYYTEMDMGSLAAPSAMTAGTPIGQFYFLGRGSTQQRVAYALQAYARNNWTDADGRTMVNMLIGDNVAGIAGKTLVSYTADNITNFANIHARSNILAAGFIDAASLRSSASFLGGYALISDIATASVLESTVLDIELSYVQGVTAPIQPQLSNNVRVTAGAGIIVTPSGSGGIQTYEVAATGGGGGGEANTASNVGHGPAKLFNSKSGVDLRFNSISNLNSTVHIVTNATDGTISLAATNIGTAQLVDAGVTLAKLANITSDRLIGRDTGGAGVPEEISVGGGLGFNGTGGIQINDAGVTFARFQDFPTDTLFGRDAAGAGVGTSITVAGGLNFSGAGGLQVADDGITDAKLRESAALSVIGRSANSTGNPADIAAANDGEVLRRSGTTVGFGAVSLSTAAAVTGNLPLGNGGTGASLADPNASRFLGWDDTDNQIKMLLYGTGLSYNAGTDTLELDADLVDLVDGSLTGTKVGFADPDNNWTATDVETALAELDNVINGGVPNSASAKVDWSQLVGVPAGFADGADDGSTNNPLQAVGAMILTNRVVYEWVHLKNDTNVVIDWASTNRYISSPSNTFTVVWQNVPTAGGRQQTVTLEIVNTNSTAAYFPTNGLNGGPIIMLSAPSTNLFFFHFDGTNFWTESGQIHGTGLNDTNVFNVQPVIHSLTLKSTNIVDGNFGFVETYPTGTGGANTNFTLLVNNNASFIINGFTNVSFRAFYGGTLGLTYTFSIEVTNGSGANRTLEFSPVTNNWVWSYAQGGTAPTVLTNSERIVIEGRLRGTNVTATYGYFPWP